MSVGIVIRVKDLARSEALYIDTFGETLDVAAKARVETRGELLCMPWKQGGCLFALEASGPPVRHGIPVIADSAALERAAIHGAELRPLEGAQEVVDYDGNIFWAFEPAGVEVRYETGIGNPILPLIYAIERGQLDPSWLQVWGHGGRDPVATAWAVSVGYLEELLARLRWTDESQRACDIYNELSHRLEPIFIQERIRGSVRVPTLQDAQLEADRVAAERGGRA
ncbi:hypothetical protein [Pendulispora albinea]|uniref:VOC domain-containing protein n=1 Tax=Pendulispora albinea TaxID=2741071 RepID=A0ABZ2MB51_9BACT